MKRGNDLKHSKEAGARSADGIKEGIRRRAIKEPLLIPYTISLALIAVSIVVLVFTNASPRVERARINGIGDTVENLPEGELNALRATLASTLALNTDRRIASIRDIHIREGSYRQEHKDGAFHTSFMVDIESLRQSYRIASTYMTAPGLNAVDYRMLVLCVFGEDVMFREFERACRDRISVENGLDWADPIQTVLPYFSTFYRIGLNGQGEGKVRIGVLIHMSAPPKMSDDLSQGEMNDVMAAERIKGEAFEKIRELGFDPDDYIIEFNWRF